MTIDEAINIILDGEAVLFIGSGFSVGAKNEDNTEFKTA